MADVLPVFVELWFTQYGLHLAVVGQAHRSAASQPVLVLIRSRLVISNFDDAMRELSETDNSISLKHLIAFSEI